MEKVTYTIEDLPEEVLEFTLGFLPPYQDLHNCMLVSRRWRKCVLNVTKMKTRNLNKAFEDFKIIWKVETPDGVKPSITKRYSHCAAVYNDSMYVFGGCTSSMTTFNDLWRLDLSTREWVRPITTGKYPSPKACSTMVRYNDTLVLFGGWTYPPAYPLYQVWYLFDELHTFDINKNLWTYQSTEKSPPPTAAHSVSIHRNWMVIFGGLQRDNHFVHSNTTNDVWALDLLNWKWHKQETEGNLKPKERYGHFQSVLDDDNLLVMGGSSGPLHYFSDAWVLNMSGDIWKWIKIDVVNVDEAPTHLCNPACKVGNKIIVLSKSRQNATPPLMFINKAAWAPPQENEEINHQRIDSANREVDRDENINGKRGTLRGVKRINMDIQPGPSIRVDPEIRSMSAFIVEDTNKLSARDLRQQKRLDVIKKAEERTKQKDKFSEAGKPKQNLMGMYVLDTTHALDESPYVEWMKNNGKCSSDGPEETVLYTLVEGKSELIMFGGIRKDIKPQSCTMYQSKHVSNSLHFLTAPNYVI